MMRRNPFLSLKPKRKLTKREEQYWDAFVFLVRLLVLAIPLYVILALPGILYPLQLWTVDVTISLLGWLGLSATADGTWITIHYANPFTFIINEDCTGWKSIMLLFALIFAVRGARLKSRLAGLALGTAAILTANMLRILGVIYAERLWGQDFALLLHDIAFRYGLVHSARHRAKPVPGPGTNKFAEKPSLKRRRRRVDSLHFHGGRMVDTIGTLDEP